MVPWCRLAPSHSLKGWEPWRSEHQTTPPCGVPVTGWITCISWVEDAYLFAMKAPLPASICE
ncbi:hypothetical protein N9029_00510 [bacterium]|nr:hypothetical protein [bacterium]